jgi:hypothetical protein
MPPVKARSSHEAPAPNGQTAEDRALIGPDVSKPPGTPGGFFHCGSLSLDQYGYR